MEEDNEGSLEALRHRIQNQLKKSGIDNAIRKMVENTCASKQSNDPEEIMEAIYSRGLMESVLRFDNDNGEGDAKVGFNINQKVSEKPAWNETKDTGWVGQGYDDEDSNEEERQGRRYYLKTRINDGKAFLDHLSHDANSTKHSDLLTLYIFFKSQRFKSRPVRCRVDPEFYEEFMIDIGYCETGSVAELLMIDEPMRIIIVHEDPNFHVTGGGVVISSTSYDWRSVLLTDNGSQSVGLELQGVGPESHVPVGLLNMKTTLLPCPEEQVSETTFLRCLQEEKAMFDESLRFFTAFSKKWMKEFLNIRPLHHALRNVRFIAFDEKFASRPVTTFIHPPCNTDRVFPTPFHAAWFVSLFSIEKVGGGGNGSETPQLQSLAVSISSKRGTLEDLSILLCSLLLGFGLNSYVACGTDKERYFTSWVVTFDNSFHPLFWDPTTAKRLNIEAADSNKYVKRCQNRGRFNTVSCLFNNEAYHANIQASDSVWEVDWNLQNSSKWKSIPPQILTKFQSHSEYPLLLSPPSLDCELLATSIELEFQDLIEEERTREGLTTRWNGTTSKLMGQQLATYELQASTGGKDFENFFKAAVMRSIPTGRDWKGFHYHSRSTNAKNIFHSCMETFECLEVVYCRGEEVEHAVRVSAFAYPENVASLRVMIGCKFLSVD